MKLYLWVRCPHAQNNNSPFRHRTTNKHSFAPPPNRPFQVRNMSELNFATSYIPHVYAWYLECLCVYHVVVATTGESQRVTRIEKQEQAAAYSVVYGVVSNVSRRSHPPCVVARQVVMRCYDVLFIGTQHKRRDAMRLCR